jgi:transaldolase
VVTTNPTIFAKATSGEAAYDGQVRDLAARGGDVNEALRALTTFDVRRGAMCCALGRRFPARHRDYSFESFGPEGLGSSRTGKTASDNHHV